MKYNYIIFDLDGTLLNTLDDLRDSTNFALRRFGFPERTTDEVRRFVGNGVARLIHLAVPEGTDEKTATRLAEKKAIEDARFVLPNACETQMVLTMNARSLMNFFKVRCCRRAQWEIQDVANQMLALVSEIAPNLFKNAGPSCVRGGCSEGKMSCGKPQEVREFYKSLKSK